MIFRALPLEGAFLIELDPQSDERGYFARTFDAAEFRQNGMCDSYPQHSIAYNSRRGVLRGLHYQAEPCGEAKLIRCVGGAIYDVVVDVRPESFTYGQWYAAELRGGGYEQIYVPPGFAHGYQTLTAESEVFYLISAEYSPDAARGYRYDSVDLGIPWPLEPVAVSKRDREWPTFVL